MKLLLTRTKDVSLNLSSAYRVREKTYRRDQPFKLGVDGTAFDRYLGFRKAVILFDMDLQCIATSVIVVKV